MATMELGYAVDPSLKLPMKIYEAFGVKKIEELFKLASFSRAVPLELVNNNTPQF